MACQQVGLAETNASVKKQGIVRLSGRLRDCERSRIGKVVVIPDDERLESVLGIKT